jgi:hypothetical protein
MKRLVFILLAIMTIMPISARNFLGCEFGDERSMVWMKLKSAGYEPYDHNGYIFVAPISFAQIDFEVANFNFSANRLSSVYFGYTKNDYNKVHDSLVERLKSKYGESTNRKLEDGREMDVWYLNEIRIICGKTLPKGKEKGSFMLIYLDTSRDDDDL